MRADGIPDILFSQNCNILLIWRSPITIIKRIIFAFLGSNQSETRPGNTHNLFTMTYHHEHCRRMSNSTFNHQPESRRISQQLDCQDISPRRASLQSRASTDLCQSQMEWQGQRDCDILDWKGQKKKKAQADRVGSLKKHLAYQSTVIAHEQKMLEEVLQRLLAHTKQVHCEVQAGREGCDYLRDKVYGANLILQQYVADFRCLNDKISCFREYKQRYERIRDEVAYLQRQVNGTGEDLKCFETMKELCGSDINDLCNASCPAPLSTECHWMQMLNM